MHTPLTDRRSLLFGLAACAALPAAANPPVLPMPRASNVLLALPGIS